MSEKMKATLASVALAMTCAGVSVQAQARDYISIVGSSTVFPFATAVAERFGRGSQFATPKIESTGTGGGMKLFCSGVGTDFPDITNASRRMKKSEFELCEKNGVKAIVEVMVGYDGIVLANAQKAPAFTVTRKDIFLALAKQVPNPDGSATLVDNPYTQWSEVNKSLPDMKIRVMGPPPTSGTRDAFDELAMQGGCEAIGFIKAMKKTDEKTFKAVCQGIREDGVYIEAGENDNLIVQKLDADKEALGVFGFSYLDQNRGKIKAATVEGEQPSFETIANGSYPVSRSLYFYVKKAHVGVVPGIEAYLGEFTNDKAWGDEGYLAEKGMIPMAADLRKAKAKEIKGLKLLTADVL